jgi:hypothetical protein
MCPIGFIDLGEECRNGENISHDVRSRPARSVIVKNQPRKRCRHQPTQAFKVEPPFIDPNYISMHFCIFAWLSISTFPAIEPIATEGSLTT